MFQLSTIQLYRKLIGGMLHLKLVGIAELKTPNLNFQTESGFVRAVALSTIGILTQLVELKKRVKDWHDYWCKHKYDIKTYER